MQQFIALHNFYTIMLDYCFKNIYLKCVQVKKT